MVRWGHNGLGREVSNAVIVVVGGWHGGMGEGGVWCSVGGDGVRVVGQCAWLLVMQVGPCCWQSGVIFRCLCVSM